MGAIPYFAEYLMTLQRPGGGYLAEQAGGQLLVPIFPPDTSVNIVVPPSNSYASIGYRYTIAIDTVPGVFRIDWRHKGRDIRIGGITATTISEGMWTFALVTTTTPFYLTMTNISGMNQYMEFVSYFIAVQSAEDLNLVWKHLRDLQNDGSSEFRTEGLKLFKQMSNWMARH